MEWATVARCQQPQVQAISLYKLSGKAVSLYIIYWQVTRVLASKAVSVFYVSLYSMHIG